MGLLLAALLALAAGAPPEAPGAREDDATNAASGAPELAKGPGRGRFLQDVGMAASASAAIALLKPDIRRALLHDARLSNVLENFAHPVRQVRIGTRRDTDPFWVNGVAHPGLFALEALCLKRRGYRDGTAFLFTQVHSVLWELAVEGSAFEPSGKDLLADAGGAAAALWVFRPIAARSARRLAEGRGRWWDRGLRWLDPVEAATPRRAPAVRLRPAVGPGAIGLELAAAF